MKTTFSIRTLRSTTNAIILLAIAVTAGCKKDDAPPTPASQQSFTEVNLVASDAALSASRVDSGLVNAWGLAFSPTGNAWISSTGKGTSVIYNSTGAQVIPAVTIPTYNAAAGGVPTGQVFNSTTGFVLSNGSAAKFIFAGVDGIISGWSSGATALVAADLHSTAAYTGLAIANNGANTFLYAANFLSGKIDMFNSNFILQATTFIDPALPAGYSPFNIQNVDGQLYVMYARRDSGSDEKTGPGLGIVSIFNPDGSFVKRFVTGGALNAPWGVAMAPANPAVARSWAPSSVANLASAIKADCRTVGATLIPKMAGIMHRPAAERRLSAAHDLTGPTSRCKQTPFPTSGGSLP